MHDLVEQLNKQTTCEVRQDELSRVAYSVDASIFEVSPQLIVLPRNRDDLIGAITLANQLEVPIIPRGAGTGTTGGALGTGMILDLSKHLNQVLDQGDGWIEVEPGVTQEQLNNAAAPQQLPLSISTGNRATVGGMIANNAAGGHSLKYGNMSHNVLDVELILADGQVITEVPPGLPTDVPPYPTFRRLVSGYNLNKLDHLPALVCGSEGTLGVVSKAKVRVVNRPQNTYLSLLSYPSVEAAASDVMRLLQYDPYAIELIDDKIIEAGRISPTMRGKLGWLKGNPGAVLVVEADKLLGDDVTGVANEVWDLRRLGVGLLMSRRSYSRAIAFIEDVAVPPEKLAPFFVEYQALLQKHGCDAGVFGHAGEGCLHVRPYIDLRKARERKLMVTLMEEVADLLCKYGGAMSGEHGDGLIRSWLNAKMFGAEVCQAFVAVKKVFDPNNRMNPGKVIPSLMPLEKLRRFPKIEAKTVYDFDLPFAADMCNGNGACRKKTGLMCPSFQASNDEYDTTRARAQALRAVFSGALPLTTDLRPVLDLCIGCKGCKTECPSAVDMARMKSEFLHRHGKHKLRDYILSRPDLAALFPFSPPNWALKAMGITLEHPLPKPAKRPFKPKPCPHPDVILLLDTFARYYDPHIAEATLALFERLGISVHIPPYRCCGRPLISKGFLSAAKKKAIALVAQLAPYANKGIPIIGLEPSCLFTIQDDYPDLIENATEVAAACTTLERFLLPHAHKLNGASTHLAIHVHCHQKSLATPQSTIDLCEAIDQLSYEIIDSGCCGMAGSFGYEAEHADFSKKIAEDRLVPAIKRLDRKSVVVANGTSCRAQVSRLTEKQPYHLTEALLKFLVD